MIYNGNEIRVKLSQAQLSWGEGEQQNTQKKSRKLFITLYSKTIHKREQKYILFTVCYRLISSYSGNFCKREIRNELVKIFKFSHSLVNTIYFITKLYCPH